MAYLSNKLDPVASGWPSCLKAITAIALLDKDADKLTLGQQITVVASHTLESITNAPVTHQNFLLTERVTFASFHLLSHCMRLHLLITALTFWQKSWYTDDSSLEVKGKQKVGTAVWW